MKYSQYVFVGAGFTSILSTKVDLTSKSALPDEQGKNRDRPHKYIPVEHS